MDTFSRVYLELYTTACARYTHLDTSNERLRQCWSPPFRQLPLLSSPDVSLKARARDWVVSTDTHAIGTRSSLDGTSRQHESPAARMSATHALDMATSECAPIQVGGDRQAVMSSRVANLFAEACRRVVPSIWPKPTVGQCRALEQQQCNHGSGQDESSMAASRQTAGSR